MLIDWICILFSMSKSDSTEAKKELGSIVQIFVYKLQKKTMMRWCISRIYRRKSGLQVVGDSLEKYREEGLSKLANTTP
jgi:hypothetical protein